METSEDVLNTYSLKVFDPFSPPSKMKNADELVNYSYQFLYRFIGIPNHRLGKRELFIKKSLLQ